MGMTWTTRTSKTTHGTHPTVATKPIRWAGNYPIPGACMTRTEMFGSGVRIGRVPILVAALLILPVLPQAQAVSNAVEPGQATHGSAGRPIVETSAPRIGAISLDYGPGRESTLINGAYSCGQSKHSRSGIRKTMDISPSVAAADSVVPNWRSPQDPGE